MKKDYLPQKKVIEMSDSYIAGLFKLSLFELQTYYPTAFIECKRNLLRIRRYGNAKFPVSETELEKLITNKEYTDLYFNDGNFSKSITEINSSIAGVYKRLILKNIDECSAKRSAETVSLILLCFRAKRQYQILQNRIEPIEFL